MLGHTIMNVNLHRPRLVNVVNSSIALGFLQGQLQYFQDKGFDVTVLCPERRKGEWEVGRPEGVPILEVPMERAIVPLRDLASLWRLWRNMRALRPAWLQAASMSAKHAAVVAHRAVARLITACTLPMTCPRRLGAHILG